LKYCPLILMALAITSTPALSKPVAPTIEQLAAFPSMSSFSISPDGKHMTAVEARGEERVILVWETANLSAPPTVIGATQMKFQSVAFIKNDLLAVSLWQPYDARFDGVTKTFTGKLFITDLKGKNWHEPMPQPRAKTEIEERTQSLSVPTVLDALPNDPDNIIAVNNVGDSSGDVFKVNIRSFKADRIQRSDDNVFGYRTDLEGNLRARTRSDIDTKGAYVATEMRDAKSGSWVEHFRNYVKDRDVAAIIGFTADPNIALLISNVGEDKLAIYEYDVASRTKGEALFKHRFFEANDAMLFRFKNGGAAFGEIAGLEYNGPSGRDIIWTAPAFKAIDATIRKALNIVPTATNFTDPATGQSAPAKYDNDQGYVIVDYSADLKSVLFSVSGSNMPPKSYLMKAGRISLLSNSFPAIASNAIGTTRLTYYKARDGLDIPAFLTIPSKELCGAGPYPTVIHPHGGPWGRDDGGFDGSMWVPLLSSRCKAVLQPQFRGSQGWGRKLWKAGDAEWGQKMQDDKDDGAKWLIDQKIAIPGRVAMFGFSYGGYAAFAAAVRPNGLYKCAIAGAGVSDIKRIAIDLSTNRFYRDGQGPTIKGLNPLEQADKIKIPMMIYHGERDQTVPIEQSQWFFAKAKQSGQAVEYHELKDFAHGPSWTRKIAAEHLRYIDNYLNKGCGGGGL
jgi:pimeloyl-ACP methyl ester carboxylesterase